MDILMDLYIYLFYMYYGYDGYFDDGYVLEIIEVWGL